MPVVVALFLLSLADGPVAERLLPADETNVVKGFAPDGQQEKESDQILSRYLIASKNNILRGVTMVAHFAGRLPKLQRSATLDARRHVSKDGSVNYEVTEHNGDRTVEKELIIRFMNGESESAVKDNTRVAITPDNYKFKYKGRREKDGRVAYVFEVNPRKKRDGLFKGEIWVDVDSCLTVRESGRFVKSPSVFLKKVEFAREYTIREGFAIPKAMQTTIETRFWGMAELDVQYSEFTWEEPPLVTIGEDF